MFARHWSTFKILSLVDSVK